MFLFFFVLLIIVLPSWLRAAIVPCAATLCVRTCVRLASFCAALHCRSPLASGALVQQRAPLRDSRAFSRSPSRSLSSPLLLLLLLLLQSPNQPMKQQPRPLRGVGLREPHDRYLSHRIHSSLVMSAFGLVVCLVPRLHSLTRHASDATPRRASEISPSCALELLDGRAGERRHSHGTSRCLQHLTLPGRNLGIVGLQRLPTPSPPPTHHHRAPCQCRGSSSFVLIVSCTLRNRWKIFLLSSGSSAGSSPTI